MVNLDSDLTILTVSFERWPLITLNRKLTTALNPESRLSWIVVDNSRTGNYRERSDSTLQVLEGIDRDKISCDQRDINNFHHALALHRGLRQIQSRYVLIQDHDFFVIRQNWIRDILLNMRTRNLSLFGSVWSPKLFTHYRYFPSVHFLLVDLKRVSVDDLDFRVDPHMMPVWRMVNSRSFPRWIPRNIAVGMCPDTGSRIYRRFRHDPQCKFEYLKPSFFPAVSKSFFMKNLLKLVLPDQLSKMPKRKGYWIERSFLRKQFPDFDRKSLDEFFWKDEPFGFHVGSSKTIKTKEYNKVIQWLEEVSDFFSKQNQSKSAIDLDSFQSRLREGISVFCAVKNRNRFLDCSLASWVRRPEIDEIIIVDWDSAERVQDIIDVHQNGKIVLVKAPQQQRWSLTKAYNLAARMTTRSSILKLDADIILRDDFFDGLALDKGCFFSGNWRDSRNKNENHLNGTFYCGRKDFFGVNGYNEKITTYGWDDADLYGRLEAKGLKRKLLPLDKLAHQPHSDETRIQAQPDVSDRKREIKKNRKMCARQAPWGAQNNMTPFEVLVISQSPPVCEAIEKKDNSPDKKR